MVYPNSQVETSSDVKKHRDCSTDDLEECEKFWACICGSSACEKARLLALELFYSTHGWSSNDGLSIVKHNNKKNLSEKVEALRQSCAHHLELDDTKKKSAVYHIASIAPLAA